MMQVNHSDYEADISVCLYNREAGRLIKMYGAEIT